MELTNHGDDVDMNPKPTRLLQRILSIGANDHSLILDSFAGSGTTGQAVHMLNQISGSRKFILVEMKPTIARTITAVRLKNAGVPFRYCTLGESLFTGDGMISGDVTRERLAHHLWFTETGEPLPYAISDGSLIGIHHGSAVHVVEGTLTVRTLRDLAKNDGPRIVYADACRISDDRLREENIVFKAVPYDVRDA